MAGTCTYSRKQELKKFTSFWWGITGNKSLGGAKQDDSTQQFVKQILPLLHQFKFAVQRHPAT